MVNKQGFATTHFDYKNCFNGTDIINEKEDPNKILSFKKGDKLPQILTDRLFQLNPEQVTFKKVKLKKVEKEKEEVEEKNKPEPIAFTKSAIIELTKDEQLKLLEDRGLDKKELSKLKTEKDRVKLILKTNPKQE